MDPQKLSQLDPKLRDAYQRVMGTVVPQPQPKSSLSPAPGAASPSSGAASPPGPAVQKPSIAPASPAQPPAIPVSEPLPPQAQQPFTAVKPPEPTSNFTQMNSETAAAQTSPNFASPVQTQTITVKKKKGIMPMLMGIIAVVFTIIYALFWIRVFNLQIPFLP